MQSHVQILIHVVTAVIDLPPQTKDALTSDEFGWTANLSLTSTLAPPDIVARIFNSPSITLFVPTNQALVDALARQRISLPMNGTALNNLVLGHVISGSVVFTGHGQSNYTSVVGETITISPGSQLGFAVYSKGKFSANIIHPDIITQNGVMHLIDAVLPAAH